jgi:hypothetical protein
MLSVDSFTKDARNKKRHGTRTDCKKCHAVASAEYRLTHPEYYQGMLDRMAGQRQQKLRERVEANPELIPRIPTIQPGEIPKPVIMNKHQRLILNAMKLPGPIPAN